MKNGRLCRTVIMTLLVMLPTLWAGCIGGPDSFPDGDIVVLKLTHDGLPEWTQIIDSGQDDGAEGLAELQDGGFAIAAQNACARRSPSRPRFVRLSPNGAILWDRLVTDSADIARAVVPAPDGGTAVLTGNGTVVRFGPEGRTLWARTTGVTEAYTILQLADGGYIVGGRTVYEIPTNDTFNAIAYPSVPPAPGLGRQSPAQTPDTFASPASLPSMFTRVTKAMVVRLTSNGAILWERQYDEDDLSWVQSLVASPDRTAFVLAGYGDPPNGSIGTPLLALRLDPDGTPISVAQLGTTPFSELIWTRADTAGYRVLYQNQSADPTSEAASARGVVDALLDRDGCVIERRSLDASIAVTWTMDGGYFSVGMPFGGGEPGYSTMTYDRTSVSTFHARKFDGTGALLWDRELPTGLISRVKMVVSTSDGGYAVLAVKDIE